MPEIEIRPVVSAGNVAICNDMQREYLAWRELRYAGELAVVHKYDQPRHVEAGLARTGIDYVLPKGSFLLAWLDGLAVGCAAFHQIGASVCELKRIYVRDTARGFGLGSRLTLATMDLAKANGYSVARLDTGFRQIEAIALYEKLGFRRIAAYYDVPPDLAAILIFMEREL